MKFELYKYFNPDTFSYIKVLLFPTFWKFGVDPYWNRDSLTIGLGPVHIVVTHPPRQLPLNDSVPE